MSGIDELLARARERLDRIEPERAHAAADAGDAALVDIRSDSQRATDGIVPGAHFIPRNVLEWRLDPEGEHRNEELVGERVILFCDEGYQSSLAAATLRELGADATDMVGGFQAWRAAGLPTGSRETAS